MADKLSELKEKLSSMGISTNTPGLRGKERLEELKNRLEDALCSDEHGRGASHIAQSEVKSIKRVVDGLSSAQIRENLILLGQVHILSHYYMNFVKTTPPGCHFRTRRPPG